MEKKMTIREFFQSTLNGARAKIGGYEQDICSCRYWSAGDVAEREYYRGYVTGMEKVISAIENGEIKENEHDKATITIPEYNRVKALSMLIDLYKYLNENNKQEWATRILNNIILLTTTRIFYNPKDDIFREV